MTINACYPAPSETETEVTTFSHSISADQSAEGYAASDLLWCHHTFDPDALSDNHVVMTFAHAMHRLEITITNESGALPTDLQVAVRTATEVTMDFESGQPKIGESTLEWITPATDPSQAGRYLTVVAPQSLASLQKEQGWIRLTSDGNTAYNAVPDQIGGSTTLNSGMESSLTLNLKGQSTEPDPDLDWANRKMWVYGVKSPVFDADKTPGLHLYSNRVPCR